MKKRFWVPALTVLILGAIHSGCSNNGPSSPSGNNSPNPPTFTPTVTDTFTQACFVGASPSCTPTASATSTNTATPTNTFTFTNTPTKTFTPTQTSTLTQTFTNTQTSTATPSPTKTPSSTPTDTSTVTPSNTPSSTATKTPTSTPSNTATMSPTNSATNSPTNSATKTPTNTPTDTFTFTPTGSATATYTPTAHFTLVTSFSVPGSSPEGVAVTITGGVTYIYVATLGGYIEYTTNLGSSWTTIGTFGTSGTAGTFTTGQEIALDGAGNLYASDPSNSSGARVQRYKISPPGWTVLTGYTYGPFGVGTDSSNNGYDSESNGSAGVIRKLAAGTTSYGSSLGYYPGATNPQGVCTDSAGNVYVVDGSAYNVYKYNGSSWGSFFGTGYPGGAGVSQLNNPHAAAWYNGNLFVADASNHRIMDISAPTAAVTGTYVLQFSGVSDPLAISVDVNGTLYVADYTLGGIEIFTYVP